MGKYLEFYYSGGDFYLFSMPHLMVIVIITALNLIVFLNRSKIKNNRCEKIFRYSIAAALLLQELSLNLWYIYTDKWSVTYSLPLHLCGASVIMCSIMLFKNSYSIYEIAYFWGLGGAVQAILTPDLGNYGFPHYRFFQFFISHGLIVTACLYMTFIQKYKPSMKSLFKAFYSANIYMVFIGIFNYFTTSNYLFICEKPQGKSLLDLLGAWPYYTISLEFIALIIFYILYLPFKLQKVDNGSRIVVINKNKLDI